MGIMIFNFLWKKRLGSLELGIKKKCVVPENIHTHPKNGYWKFQGGEGVSKAKIFKGKYEAKLEIPGGVGGSKPKTHPRSRRYGYFL